MALAGKRHFVALDARAVSAAAVSGGLSGGRLSAFARVPLAPGVLVPSASGDNVRRPDELREALRRACAALPSGARGVTLVLPDGLARLGLVALSPDADVRELVRFRLCSALPWAGEALVETLPAGSGHAIGAALRRSAVAEYERAVGSAGLSLDRVHLAPLLALSALLRGRGRDAVHVVLSDASACLAGVRGGRIVTLRTRRRDPGAHEACRLHEEALRTARLSGDGDGLALVLSGADAARLRVEVGALLGAGERAEIVEAAPGWPDAIEAAWLRGVLA